MANLFNHLGSTQSPAQPNIIQQFKQFKQMFTGNPQQQVQQLLNSGKVTQAQYDRAVQMANQLQQLLK